MSSKSQEFEQQIQRIYSLVHNSEANVTWNDRIIAPDNYPSLRQIDVLIKNEDLLTLVECRIHNKRQNVQWIEELIGRKISLNAHSIIGVSSNGFTKGAIKKAKAHGVILSDLMKLSDNEIISWGSYLKISIFYNQFKNITLTIYVSEHSKNNIKKDAVFQNLLDQSVYQNLFAAVSNTIDQFQLPPEKLLKLQSAQGLSFKQEFAPSGLMIQDVLIQKILLDGQCTLTEMQQLHPNVFAFGGPHVPISTREIYIQQFDSTGTEIIHSNNNILITIDVSRLILPELALFKYACCESSKDVTLTKIIFQNPEKVLITVSKKIEIRINSC